MLRLTSRLLLSAAVTTLFSLTEADASDCESNSFESTYALIQQAIFENKGCTSQICHGQQQEGGLDLRADVSYDRLIDVDSETVPGFKRVQAGDKDGSLLWLNLAAKTFPSDYQAPLRPMPLDPVPALLPEELQAVRLWIEGGAPKQGVVKGTAELLDACLPPPDPIAIRPLDPPAPGEGVQIKMPRWILEAESEHEVCFATYYDVTNQVPSTFRDPEGTHFRYKRLTVRQDPLSHHLIPFLYQGVADVDDPSWGPFLCRGGDLDGQPCDPVVPGACGEAGGCATAPKAGVACIGFGPGDAGTGISSAGIAVVQETATTFAFAEGVFDELPLRGIVLWNSHAFNPTGTDGKLEAWLNFDFAAPEEQLAQIQQIFNAEKIYGMQAPAFATDEPCHLQIMEPGSSLIEVSGHMHQRGKRFRIFDGAFTCDGGKADKLPCSPVGYDFISPDVCGGAPCVSKILERVGDCDLSGDVTVNELITSVKIALGTADVSSCYEADIDTSSTVSVHEIITGVNAALNGVPAPTFRDPDDSLLYVNLQYNDPVVLRFDPPRQFPGLGSRDSDRALTFCALYDNGYSDPNEVKKRSTSPLPPVLLPVGGPCADPTGCTEGRVGERCEGSDEASRHASCDTSPGVGDGFCDACPLRGGVTTEDEMFILLGQFFLP